VTISQIAWTAAMTIDTAIQEYFTHMGLRRKEGHSTIIETFAALTQLAIDRSCGELEEQLRREWWCNHGCAGTPYGDDGEMQCCMIDFKRMPFAELRKKVEEIRLVSILRKANT
jgi:hypothetical protein